MSIKIKEFREQIERYWFELSSYAIILFVFVYDLFYFRFIDSVKAYNFEIERSVFFIGYMIGYGVIIFLFDKILNSKKKKYNRLNKLTGLILIALISYENIWIIQYNTGLKTQLFNEFVVLFLMGILFMGIYILVENKNHFLEFLGMYKGSQENAISNSGKITGISLIFSSILFLKLYGMNYEKINQNPLEIVYWTILVVIFLVFFDAIHINLEKHRMKKKYH